MAMKSIILITLLVVVFVAPQANAQPVFVRINGTVPCSLNASVVLNVTTPTLPFPNARVQLMLSGIPILSTTTNALGQFTFSLTQSLLTNLANILSLNPTVVVTTPLSSCNSTLPSTAFLTSVLPLQPVGNALVVTTFIGIRI